MRIIAGQRRGHKIDGPRASAGTRPTSDLVRESLFNILGELVVDRTVLDLFAGTGALGLEALSRGASHAVFVERDRDCLGLIIRNVAKLRYEDCAPRSGSRRCLSLGPGAFQPADRRPGGCADSTRPIRITSRRGKALNQMIAQVVEKVPAGSVVVVEAGRVLDERILDGFQAPGISAAMAKTQIAIKVIAARTPVDTSSSHRIEPASTNRRLIETKATRRLISMSDDASGRDFALEVVRRLQQAGHQALWAGGCVRDLILGETPADYDVATDATPEQVMAILPFRAVPVGISFGVVRVRHSHGPGGVEVEVATFRSDGAYVDGRRPESVVFSSPELDAARRDFTINGMFLDPLTGEVIDYVGGHPDSLKNRILRRDRRPHRSIPRGQAARAARDPAGGAVSVSDRAGHSRRDQVDGSPGRHRFQRADRPGAAKNARARQPGRGDETGPRHRSRRRRPPGLVADEGDVSGQANAARG